MSEITINEIAAAINAHTPVGGERRVRATVRGEQIVLTEVGGGAGGAVVLVDGRIEKAGRGSDTKGWAYQAAQRALDTLRAGGAS